jgi:hypothetical protein
MTGFLEDNLLRFEGLSDQDIATLNAALPDVQNLLTVLEAHMPQINRVMNDLGPIIQKIIAKQRTLT